MITWETLPDALQELQFARTSIRGANIVNGMLVRHNVKAHISNALANVVPTAAITKAQNDAISAGVRLGTYLADRGPLADNTKVEQLKAAALASLDLLVDTLNNCKPNDMANALGLGW